MFVPSVIVLDFETALTDGAPSTEFYRSDFRAVSCAFAWRGETGELKTAYREGETAIRKFLEKCAKDGAPLVAHNAQFEMGVLRYRFPHCKVNLCIDTMRLVQVGDGGKLGKSLVKSASRWLNPEHHDHKKPYHDLIASRGGKGGKDLHLLTSEELQAYNVADVVVTLHLYESLTSYFKDIRYDWRPDHELFFANLPFIVGAEAEGVLVDRPQAKMAMGLFSEGIRSTQENFHNRYAAEITEVERRLREAVASKYKTDKGREQGDYSKCKFNIYSTGHLRRLFVDVLGLKPRFFTEKGNPTFSSKLLWAFGEPGLMLDKKGRYKVQHDQATALYENSERDGRWHLKIKAVGTVTDRYAGGEHGSD